MRRFRPRASVIALAALAIGVGAWVSIAGLSKASGRKPARGTPVVIRANSGALRSLGNFVRIPGTPFLLADIHSSGEGRQLSFSSYSYGNGLVIHNYVFLNITDQSVRRLVSTNDYFIRLTEQLSDTEVVSPPASNKGGVRNGVRWMLFEVVKQDTDHDGDLDGEDLRTLAVSDAGGRGYTELIGGIGDLYGRALRDPDTLVVVYESGGTKRVSVIDLPRRVVTSTAALPGLGTDVR